MTTPYGSTTFRRERPSDSLWMPFIEATNGLGRTERLQYLWISEDLPASLPRSEVPSGFAAYNQDMNKYNTFYWDHRAWDAGPNSTSTAMITRWLLVEDLGYASYPAVPVPHSIKRPLESRVWYSYPGQLPGYEWLLQTHLYLRKALPARPFAETPAGDISG